MVLTAEQVQRIRKTLAVTLIDEDGDARIVNQPSLAWIGSPKVSVLHEGDRFIVGEMQGYAVLIEY